MYQYDGALADRPSKLNLRTPESTLLRPTSQSPPRPTSVYWLTEAQKSRNFRSACISD